MTQFYSISKNYELRMAFSTLSLGRRGPIWGDEASPQRPWLANA